MKKRRTAAEIIATHLCWDVSEVSDCRYQPTRYNTPSIYAIGDGYYTAPSNNKPPKNMTGEWKNIGVYYERIVYYMHMNERSS